MAKRQARFTPQELAGDPRLDDQSGDLWNEELPEVARGLLTSAVRCFASNGYHATTTRDITTGVGLSPAALYVYFPSKEFVLFEITRVSHERVLAYLRDSAVEEAGGSADRLRALVFRYTVWHARHHVGARVAQYELAGLTGQHYDEVLKLRRRTTELFRGVVARGVADGTFDEVDVNRVVRAMLSLGIDLGRWYRLDGPERPEEIGDFYAGLAVKMVMNPTPHERPTRSPAGRAGRRRPARPE